MRGLNMEESKKYTFEKLTPVDDCDISVYESAIEFAFEEKTIFYKGIMPSEKVLDLPVDCNTLAGSVNL